MPKPKRNLHAVEEETLTPPPTLLPSQTIARVDRAAGNNLYHLTLPSSLSSSSILAELPARFRSTIWIKRGTYVLVDAAATADRDNKIGGEIVNVVRDEKAWRKMAYWPKEFGVRHAAAYGSEGEDGEESDHGPRMPPSEDEDED